MNALPRDEPAALPAVELAVLRPRGDLDGLSAHRVREDLMEVVAGGAACVVVDLADVRFLDSTGLATLVGVHRSLPPGQRLALANVPARLQRALRISAVSTLFLVHEQGQPWPGPGVIDTGA